MVIYRGIICTIVLFLSSCMLPPSEDMVEMVIEDPDLTQIEDGKYHGTYGDPGDINNPGAFVCGVVVAIVENEYASITILDNETSERVLNGGGLLDDLIERVLEDQSMAIDAVSGATATGKVVLKSVENALSDSRYAQRFETIQLPDPQTDAGRPLMQVLKDRRSGREFSSEDLNLQVLSNMLWAAFGINRPASGKRTAPSAVNWQEIDIYVSRSDGLYLYEAAEHTLEPILERDIRAQTGTQSFVAEAPVNLIYVADYSKMATFEKSFYSAAATGHISQNVYLFCASEGLSAVVRGLVDRPMLSLTMGLGIHQHITLSQTVGYPRQTE